MPVGELPTDVLTELGRVTWAAIKLEDYAESVCSFIDPSNPRTDKRSISKKIKDAKQVLADWPGSSARDDAIAWLDRAHQAIERRNAALHATPVVQLGRSPDVEPRLFLGEMPRKGRPYVERALTVESLTELRYVLDHAPGGWREIVLAVSSESVSQKAEER